MNDPRTHFDHKFENPFAQNRSRLSQTSGNCTSSYYNDHDSLQFRPNLKTDDSGVCSPPLWKNSPSPPRSPSQPLLNPHRSLSPNSRIQAITRGQRELMEMVRNMPESSYELSLKDLVENQRSENPNLSNRDFQKRVVVKVKRQESKKNEKGLMRIESFENKRVFLKMVIPFSLKSKKVKRNLGGSSRGKVSPKPEGGRGGEMEWWKKKFSGSSDSDRSRRSCSSSGRSDGGAGGRGINGFLTGCWPFLRSRRSKTVE